MGTANGLVAGTLAPLHNGDVLAGSRDQTGDPSDPPKAITRACSGSPGVPADATILHGADALPQLQEWTKFRTDLENAHDTAHEPLPSPLDTLRQRASIRHRTSNSSTGSSSDFLGMGARLRRSARGR